MLAAPRRTARTRPRMRPLTVISATLWWAGMCGCSVGTGAGTAAFGTTRDGGPGIKRGDYTMSFLRIHANAMAGSTMAATNRYATLSKGFWSACPNAMGRAIGLGD